MFRRWRELRRRSVAKRAEVGIDEINDRFEALGDQVFHLESIIITTPARAPEGMARKLSIAIAILDLEYASDSVAVAVRSTHADLVALGATS